MKKNKQNELSLAEVQSDLEVVSASLELMIENRDLVLEKYENDIKHLEEQLCTLALDNTKSIATLFDSEDTAEEFKQVLIAHLIYDIKRCSMVLSHDYKFNTAIKPYRDRFFTLYYTKYNDFSKSKRNTSFEEVWLKEILPVDSSNTKRFDKPCKDNEELFNRCLQLYVDRWKFNEEQQRELKNIYKDSDKQTFQHLFYRLKALAQIFELKKFLESAFFPSLSKEENLINKWIGEFKMIDHYYLERDLAGLFFWKSLRLLDVAEFLMQKGAEKKYPKVKAELLKEFSGFNDELDSVMESQIIPDVPVSYNQFGFEEDEDMMEDLAEDLLFFLNSYLKDHICLKKASFDQELFNEHLRLLLMRQSFDDLLPKIFEKTSEDDDFYLEEEDQ